VALASGEYELVVSVRADLGYRTKLPVELMLDFLRGHADRDNLIFVPQGNDFGDGLCDHVAAGTPAAMRRFAAAYKAFDGIMCSQPPVGGLRFHPERLLREHVSLQGLEVWRFPLDYAIVRDVPSARNTVMAQVTVQEFSSWAAPACVHPTARLLADERFALQPVPPAAQGA